MTDDMKPCPSCREPLDHPSGDGCANMTAHKERAMTDAELIARLRWRRDSLDAKAADRIEALLVGHELQEVIDKQAALLADAYGADLDWEEVLKQRADHEAVKRIEALEAKLGEQNLLWQAYDGDLFQAYVDANEARIDAEAKLASGVIAEYDDDSTVFLSGYAGGAAIGGAWSTLTLMEKASDGTLRVREYKAQGDWRATLAEIKGESHD